MKNHHFSSMLEQFTGHLYKSQAVMLRKWCDPTGSCAQFTRMANHMADQVIENYVKTFSALFPGEGGSNSDTQHFRSTEGRLPPAKTGHTAVVTGGVGGIGTEICRVLARRGNQVVATYIAAEKEYAGQWRAERLEEGFDIDIIECDVRDFESCKRVNKTLAKKYESIDILVNCAGITCDAMLKKMDEDHWHSVLDTNLDSIFNVTRNLINGMVKRGYGRIINISSVNGRKGQFGQTNYAAAKAGMVGFTKSLARELAGSGITVNTVSPGYVSTSMVEAIPEEVKNAIIAKIPVGRLGKPSEIGDAVAFLSDQSSAYITGSDIPVNGGLFMG